MVPAFALKVDQNQQSVQFEALTDYDECQSRDYEGDWCNKALLVWVKAHPKDAFKAGKITRLHMNHYAALPFFTQAFQQKQGDCKDNDLKLAVVAGLGLEPENSLQGQAQKIAFENCFKDLKAALVEGLSEGGYYVSNACAPLRKKSALTGDAVAKCEGK